MQFKDQLHRILHLNELPKRIISLVPSQTELLVDLGLEDKIVGVTKFCVHPKHLRKEKTVVGGTKAIHLDKIEALQPDIILCNKEENTQEMVESLETIAPVHVSDIFTVEDCLELIVMYAELFRCEANAQQIIATIKEEKNSFETFISGRLPKKTAYFIWKAPWMVAGSNTYINQMLRLNKFENYYEDLERYPEVSLERENKDVELVLLSSEPYPFKEKHIEALTPYYPNAKLLLVDGEAFSWYGSRLSVAFKYFKTLHQDYLD